MRDKIVVAVDGPAGSGKSSVSRILAINLELKYIDSGAIYRSITWYILQIYGNIPESSQFIMDLDNITVTQEFISGVSKTYANSRDVSQLIRDELITKNIGIISDNKEVRNFVNMLLRKWAEDESIIMDGRDIGTVVFPDADLKIFLDASVEVRAERRIKEYREMGKNLDENDVKKQIIQRDKEDQIRPYGALIQAEDAIYIDTSDMSKNEVIEKIETIYKEYINNNY